MISKKLRFFKSIVAEFIRRFFFLCARPLNLTISSGPILVLSPHPDDETLGCGCAIIKAREAGLRVRVIIVTDGRASNHSSIITPDQLIAIRQKETLAATEILGVDPSDVIFLPFADGQASKSVPAIATEIDKQIKILEPGLIFSPYIIDGHADHRAVATAVDDLIKSGALTVPVYEYPVWFWPWQALVHVFKPWTWKRLTKISTDAYLDRKKAALHAYRSQLTNLTGEKTWWVLEQKFLINFFQPYEIFFRKNSH